MVGEEGAATVAVYGATGGTGREVVREALRRGLRVRACCVRDLEKARQVLGADVPGLEVLPGDVQKAEDVAAGLEGPTDFVVACVGGPHFWWGGVRSYKPGYCLDFVKHLVAACRKKGAKRLAVQSGAMCRNPKKAKSAFEGYLRAWGGILRFLGMPRLIGLHPTLADNAAVMEFLHTECEDLHYFCTLPGQLVDKPARGELKASAWVGGTVHYPDLAKFTLDQIQDPASTRQFVYPAYMRWW